MASIPLARDLANEGWGQENFSQNNWQLPQYSSLLKSLSSMPQFQAITAPQSGAPSPVATLAGAYTQNPYQAKDMSNASLPQFDLMRQQVSNQYNQTQGQAQDSIDRQFAAMGGGPGNGAQLKQTENLATGIAQQKGQDLLGIGAQEAATRTQLQQQENQNAFQSGEAQKGYGFQAGQTANAQNLQASEFNAGQNLQNNQFNTGLNLQTQQYNQNMQQQQNQFNFQGQTGLSSLNLQYQQAAAEYANNQFNKALSEYQGTHSGGLLGGGGFLGTGL